MRIKLDLSKGFYLTYPDGAIAYPQNFETQELAEQKRDKLGFSDWKVKEVK